MLLHVIQQFGIFVRFLFWKVRRINGIILLKYAINDRLAVNKAAFQFLATIKYIHLLLWIQPAYRAARFLRQEAIKITICNALYTQFLILTLN